jgi:hypothetical protein
VEADPLCGGGSLPGDLGGSFRSGRVLVERAGISRDVRRVIDAALARMAEVDTIEETT